MALAEIYIRIVVEIYSMNYYQFDLLNKYLMFHWTDNWTGVKSMKTITGAQSKKDIAKTMLFKSQKLVVIVYPQSP